VSSIVYVPGNHDHTIWTDYCRTKYQTRAHTTGVHGESLVEGRSAASAAAAALLSVFFAGNPVPFRVANPVYVANGTPFRTNYVFTHGTHFRQDVDLRDVIRNIFDKLEFDHIAGLELESGGDVRNATSLANLEEIVTPFVDTLWPSSGDNPVSRSDEIWYFLTLLSGKFEKKRPAPEETQAFIWDQLPDQPRFGQLTPSGHGIAPSLKRFEQFVLPHLRTFLQEALVPSDQFTLVYGDTHDGGWGVLDGGKIPVFNTGAWVVHGAQHHPPCHLFAIDATGTELFADVSFGGVTLHGKSLLEQAALDVENRKLRVSPSARTAARVTAKVVSLA
jgi:hypothetical protein